MRAYMLVVHVPNSSTMVEGIWRLNSISDHVRVLAAVPCVIRENKHTSIHLSASVSMVSRPHTCMHASGGPLGFGFPFFFLVTSIQPVLSPPLLLL